MNTQHPHKCPICADHIIACTHDGIIISTYCEACQILTSFTNLNSGLVTVCDYGQNIHSQECDAVVDMDGDGLKAASDGIIAMGKKWVPEIGGYPMYYNTVDDRFAEGLAFLRRCINTKPPLEDKDGCNGKWS